MEPAGEVTRLLSDIRSGQTGAASRLFELVHAELRRLASGHMRREGPGHVLQTTALVNETYLRLFGNGPAPLNGSEHFFRAASRAMRNILIDDARNRHAGKRGGPRHRVDLEDWMQVASAAPDWQIDLERALQELSSLDARQAGIMEMLIFGGRTKDEIASLLEISTRTVEREVATATLFLRERLASGGAE